MYKNKIVCAIKHNNKPLAEDKDSVFIPFNTEYSIYLKNMADTIAYISVYVNGEDINPGKKIRLYPKCTATVEKFQNTNHRFSFKEKTLGLQEVRENTDEDGLIRLEVSFQVKSYINQGSLYDQLKEVQKDKNPFIPGPGVIPSPYFGDPTYPHLITPYCGDIPLDGGVPLNFETIKSNMTLSDENNLNSAVTNSITLEQATDKAYVPLGGTHPFEGKLASASLNSNNSGFTAPGKKKIEKDDVSFYNGCNYEVNNEFSWIIRLEESSAPIADKEIKKICPTCKTKFKNKYFYCPFDGTFLDED